MVRRSESQVITCAICIVPRTVMDPFAAQCFRPGFGRDADFSSPRKILSFTGFCLPARSSFGRLILVFPSRSWNPEISSSCARQGILVLVRAPSLVFALLRPVLTTPRLWFLFVRLLPREASCFCCRRSLLSARGLGRQQFSPRVDSATSWFCAVTTAARQRTPS
jgi:hypothetical protein